VGIVHPGGYERYTLVYMPGYTGWVYSLPAMVPTMLPGYTQHATRRSSVGTRCQCSAWWEREEALGSNPGIIREYAAKRASQLPKV